MKIRHVAGGALLGLVTLAPHAAAQHEPAGKLRVAVNGLWSGSKVEWDATRAYTEYSESSSVAGTYTLDAGFGFEAGVRYDFTKTLGVAASYAARSGDAAATFSTSLPHPLFYNRKRDVSGEATGLSYKEQSEHVGLVLGTSSGKLDLALTAGVAFFQVESEQIDTVQYHQDYPYDTATVTGTTRVTSKDSPVGFSVAASVDYRVHAHVALGALVRYAGATAQISEADESTADLKVGGLQVGAGIRLIF